MAAAKKSQSDGRCEDRASKQKHGNDNQRNRKNRKSASSRKQEDELGQMNTTHSMSSDELGNFLPNASVSNHSASSLYSISSVGGASAMAAEAEMLNNYSGGSMQSINIEDIEQQNKLEDSSVDTREDEFHFSSKQHADALKRRKKLKKRASEKKENRQLRRRSSIGKRRDTSLKSKLEEHERDKSGSLSSSKAADINGIDDNTTAAAKSSKTKKKKKRGASLKRHERPLQATVDKSADLGGSAWWNLSSSNCEEQVNNNSSALGAVLKKSKRRKDRSKSMIASSKSVPFLDYKHGKNMKKTSRKSSMLEDFIESGAAKRRASLVEEEFDGATAVSAPDFIPSAVRKANEEFKKSGRTGTLNEMIAIAAAERQDRVEQAEANATSFKAAVKTLPSPKSNDEDAAAVERRDRVLRAEARAIIFQASVGTLPSTEHDDENIAVAEQQDRVAQAEVDALPSPENNDEDAAAVERRDRVLRAEARAIIFQASVGTLPSIEHNDENIAVAERQDLVVEAEADALPSPENDKEETGVVERRDHDLRAEARAIVFKASVDTLQSQENDDEDTAAVERQDLVAQSEANTISMKATLDALPSAEDNNEQNQDIKVTGHASTLNEMIAFAAAERQNRVARVEANALSIKATGNTLDNDQGDQDDQDIKVTGHASTLNEMIAAAAAERQNRVARAGANAASLKTTVETLPIPEETDQDIKVTGHASTLNEMIAFAATERRNRIERGESNSISVKAPVETSSSESRYVEREEMDTAAAELVVQKDWKRPEPVEEEIYTAAVEPVVQKIWKRPEPVEEEKTAEQKLKEKYLAKWKDRTWKIKYNAEQRKQDMDNHRKLFIPVVGEAATYGRLVRLEEKIVESQGGQHLGNDSDNTWSGPKLHDDRRSNALTAIQEAAAMGRLKRLKPETVTSHNEVDIAERIREDYFDVDNQYDENGDKILRTNFLLDQHVKKLAKGKKNRMFSDSDLIDDREHKIRSYADFDDVKLPTEVLPTFDRIRGQQLKSRRKRNFKNGADLAVIAMKLSDKKLAFEIDDDPDDPAKMTPGRFRVLEAISRNVASSAWERAYRLQKPRAMLKVTNKCNCPYCGDPTPFQTHKYKRLMYPERFPDTPDHMMQCQEVVDSAPTLPDISNSPQNNEYFITPGGRKKKKIRIVRRKKKRSSVVGGMALTNAISPNSKQRVVDGTFLTPDQLDSLTEQLQRQGAGSMTTDELVQIAAALNGCQSKVSPKIAIGNEEESSNLNDQIHLSTQSENGTNGNLSTEKLLQTAAELSAPVEIAESNGIDATNEIQQDDQRTNLNISLNLSSHKKEIDIFSAPLLTDDMPEDPPIISAPLLTDDMPEDPSIFSAPLLTDDMPEDPPIFSAPLLTDDMPESPPLQMRPPKAPSRKPKPKLSPTADFRNTFNSPVPRKPKTKVNADTSQEKNSSKTPKPKKSKLKLSTRTTSKSMSPVPSKEKLKINAAPKTRDNSKSPAPQKAKLKLRTKTKSKSLPEGKPSAETKTRDSSKSPAPQKAKLKLTTKNKSKSISPVPKKTKIEVSVEARTRSSTKSPVPRKAKMRNLPGPPLSLVELSNSSDHLSSSSHHKTKSPRRRVSRATPDSSQKSSSQKSSSQKSSSQKSSSQKSSSTLPCTPDESPIESKNDLSKKTLRARLKGFNRSASVRSTSPHPSFESKSTSNHSAPDPTVDKPKAARRGGRRSHSVESRLQGVVQMTNTPVATQKAPRRANSLKKRKDSIARRGKESLDQGRNSSTPISQPEKQSQMTHRQGARNWKPSQTPPTRTRSLSIGRKQVTPEDCNQEKKSLESGERKSDTRIFFSENQPSRKTPTRSRSFQHHIRSTNIHAITSSLNLPSSTMTRGQLERADTEFDKSQLQKQQRHLASNSMDYPAPPSFKLLSSKGESVPPNPLVSTPRNPEKVMKRGRSLDRINIKRLTGHGVPAKKEKSEGNGRLRRRRNSITGGWFSKKGQ